MAKASDELLIYLDPTRLKDIYPTLIPIYELYFSHVFSTTKGIHVQLYIYIQSNKYTHFGQVNYFTLTYNVVCTCRNIPYNTSVFNIYQYLQP
jgi:hypothetical protein